MSLLSVSELCVSSENPATVNLDTTVRLRAGIENKMMARRPIGGRGRRASGKFAIAIAIALVAVLSAYAAATDNLYRAQTTVTGQGEANRLTGFAACLEDVLIKVSGALKLAGDDRLAAFKSHAADFVGSWTYHDQMSGKPKRDEQGTRDRPYDLTVEFDRQKIDDVLKALGLKPWLSPRPSLGVFVGMEQGARQYVVTTDAKQFELEREALLLAADKRGMNIALPDVAALAKFGIDAMDLLSLPPATLASVAAGQGGEVVLVGHLLWVDQQLGWATEWRMDWQGRPHRWQSRKTTFDEAFRRGIGGAAQILSGNGEPSG
jgi:uncharacterized protein